MSKSGKVFWIAIAAAIVAMIVVAAMNHSNASVAASAAPGPQPTSVAWLLARNDIGTPISPGLTYTKAQARVIESLYRGEMDGAKRFQEHCGKADVAYVRSTGEWRGATTLAYSTGQNAAVRDDVSVIIAKRKDLPRELGDLYAVGAGDNGDYAMQVYLARNGIQKVALDPGRAVVLLGCHP